MKLKINILFILISIFFYTSLTNSGYPAPDTSETKKIQNFEEKAKKNLDPSRVSPDKDFSEIIEDFTKLPAAARIKVQALLEKVLEKFLTSLPDRPQVKKAMTVVLGTALQGALIASGLVLASATTGKFETGGQIAEQALQKAVEGAIAGGVDALGKLLISRDTKLQVTPITNATISGGRSLLVTPALTGTDVTKALSGAEAGKAAVVNILLNFIEKRGGFGAFVKNIQIYGGVKPTKAELEEIDKALVVKNKKEIEKGHAPLINRVKEALQKILKDRNALGALNAILVSAGSSAAIYYILSTMGIAFPNLPLEVVTIAGALQGLLNYALYKKTHVGAIENITHSVTLTNLIPTLVPSIAAAGATTLVPTVAYTAAKIAVDDLAGKSGGVVNLTKDIYKNTQFLPNLKPFWSGFKETVKDLFKAAVEFTEEMEAREHHTT